MFNKITTKKYPVIELSITSLLKFYHQIIYAVPNLCHSFFPVKASSVRAKSVTRVSSGLAQGLSRIEQATADLANLKQVWRDKNISWIKDETDAPPSPFPYSYTAC